MKTAALVGMFGILLAATSTATAQTNEEIYGTWRLLSWTRHLVGTGENVEVFGKAPHGFLNYGRDGRMLVMIVKENRPKPTELAKMSDQERAELFKTMLAYGGRFRIDGNRVVHNVDISSNETWTGTAQVRNFRIEGRRLTISVDPQIGFDGRQSTAVLTWEKIQ
jgi:hypothetical protein